MSAHQELIIAWAAGLFDGEGCVSVHYDRGANRFALQLRLSMTDWLTVRRFRRIVACGTLRRQLRAPPRAPSYTWTVCQAHAVVHALDLLRPHLFAKLVDADLARDFLLTRDAPTRYEIFKRLRARKTKPGNRKKGGLA